MTNPTLNIPNPPSAACPLAALLIILFLAVALGTVALHRPAAAAPGDRLDLADALFAAVAAVTNTGLAVRDAADRFTPLGQTIILILMQLGALATITTATLIFLRMLRPAVAPTARVTTTRVVSVFLMIQLIGFIALLFALPRSQSWPTHAFTALFDAISAVTNTGLRAHSDPTLTATHPTTHLILTPLILFGAAGGVLLFWHRNTDRPRTLDPVPRRILIALLAVYALATLTLFIVLSFSANPDPAPDRYLQSAALAASRTTGFNFVDPATLPPAARLALMPLMFIGAAPGSPVAGLGLLALALLCSRAPHSPNPQTLRRYVITILTAELVLVLAAAYLLALVEAPPLGHLLFTALSATSNAGLDVGITPQLTTYGRLILTAAMLAGRILPLCILTQSARAK